MNGSGAALETSAYRGLGMGMAGRARDTSSGCVKSNLEFAEEVGMGEMEVHGSDASGKTEINTGILVIK